MEQLLTSIPPHKIGFTGAKDGQQSIPPAEVAKLEIENGTHQLETLLNAAIDKNFDLFELYTMQNILAVRPEDRPFMRLSHYQRLDFSTAPDRPTTDSITALRRRVQASQKLNIALDSERARNEALLKKLRTVIGGAVFNGVKREEGTDERQSSSVFKFLKDRGDLEAGSVDQPLSTTTEFTLSQLQALRTLSTSLRKIIPDLLPNDEGDEVSRRASSVRKSWRRDRVEYVEGSSRKYLEKVGGLELGRQGEVRDGEWQGEGRALSRSEVEGLEKVVTVLERDKLDEAATVDENMDEDES